MDIPAASKVLDMRPVFWSGRLCLVWAEWRDKRGTKECRRLRAAQAGHQRGVHDPERPVVGAVELAQLPSETTTLPREARLIATVWVDRSNPKGKLGVLLIHEGSTSPVKNVYAVSDVLFRP